MTDNEAKDILRIIGWNRAEEGDIEGCLALDMAIQAIEEIQQYRANGTLEEFNALKEKSEPKKVAYQGEHEKCPACGSFHVFGNFCTECGQALDWSE